jgi:DNA (cytosine-5)-methyltransferase 1
MVVNYLSVCSGIEAATVAWHEMGWNPVGFSEIEKFPSEVLKHHYPNVPNFGDMTKYKEWKIDSVGLLVGGTPCQSFSVAGLRKGLSDPRGNLALTYVGILDHFRPKWFIWENVPGVLSSGQGRDFAAFLTALGIIGYGWSYRVLDAQYFGVAQRRRRVFVVGCLGDWRPTAKVLFESESLRRNIKKGKEKGEKSTANVKTSIAYENHPSDSRVKEMGDVCQTVTSSWGTGGGNIPFVQNVPISWDAELNPNENKMGTLMRGGQGGRMEGVAIPYDLYQITSPLNGQRRENGDPCHTLARDNAAYASVVTNIQGNLIGRDKGGQNGVGVSENEAMYTLTKTDVQAVAFTTEQTPKFNNQQALTLTQSEHKHNQCVLNQMTVRRLTPVECERLQGFPDNYTNIKENCPDGHRYKALGNSMAVPVMKWIGKRINEVENERI